MKGQTTSLELSKLLPSVGLTSFYEKNLWLSWYYLYSFFPLNLALTRVAEGSKFNWKPKHLNKNFLFCGFWLTSFLEETMADWESQEDKARMACDLVVLGQLAIYTGYKNVLNTFYSKIQYLYFLKFFNGTTIIWPFIDFAAYEGDFDGELEFYIDFMCETAIKHLIKVVWLLFVSLSLILKFSEKVLKVTTISPACQFILCEYEETLFLRWGCRKPKAWAPARWAFAKHFSDVGSGSGSRRQFDSELCSATWAWENHKFSGFGQIISNIYSNSNSLALLSAGETSAIDSTNPKVRRQVSDTLGLSRCLFARSSEWSEGILVMVTCAQNMAGLPGSPWLLLTCYTTISNVNGMLSLFVCLIALVFFFLFLF